MGPTLGSMARAINERRPGKEPAKRETREPPATRAQCPELSRAVRRAEREFDNATEIKPLPKGFADRAPRS